MSNRKTKYVHTFYNYRIIYLKPKRKKTEQTLGSFVVISFFTFAQVATSAAAIMEKNKHKSGGVNKNWSITVFFRMDLVGPKIRLK